MTVIPKEISFGKHDAKVLTSPSAAPNVALLNGAPNPLIQRHLRCADALGRGYRMNRNIPFKCSATGTAFGTAMLRSPVIPQ